VNRIVQIVLALAAAAVMVVASLLFLASPGEDRETLYQIGSLDDLVNGRLDGARSVGGLLGRGDLGLGTFNALNGEMIVIDGKCYRASADGTVSLVSGSEPTPFAQVGRFDRDGSVHIAEAGNLSDVAAAMGSSLPTSTAFYLLRADGTFNITVRSVPAQSAPYPPLEDVIANQSVFQYHEVRGTLIGLWTPAGAAGLSSAGFHYHFISDDRTRGGHVLDVELHDVTVYYDITPGYEVDLI
jgi:acetolactate decarboxylase